MRWLIALAACIACGAALAETQSPEVAELRRTFPEAREFTVDGDQSWIRILIYSDGVLAGLGHNHVIVARRIEGVVRLGDTLSGSGVALVVPVDGLDVDDPQARAAAGEPFEGSIPPDDRAATRSNMLGEDLLHADQYPRIRILVSRISGERPDITLDARVRLAGQDNPVDFPARLEREENRLRATGSLTVTHAQLGLTPFTAALGTLRVAEEIDLEYHIVARPAP